MNCAKTLRRHVYHPGTFSISSSTGEVKLERSLDVTVSRRNLLEVQVTDGLHLAQVSTVPDTQCAHLETRRHFSRMPAARFLYGLCVCVCVCLEALSLYGDIIIWERAGAERAKQVPLWRGTYVVGREGGLGLEDPQMNRFEQVHVWSTHGTTPQHTD